MFVTSRSRSPSLSMSPAASVRPTPSGTKPGPDVRPTSLKSAAAVVAEQQLALRILRAGPEVPRVVDHVAVRRSPGRDRRRCRSRKTRAEADEGKRRDADAALGRRLGEQAPTEIPEERVRLEFVVRHEEVEAAVAVVVAEIGAHPGAGPPVGRDADAGRQRHLPEHAVAFVVEQEVRRRVVGHEDVRPPVIVVVADDDAEAVAAMTADARLLADVGEGAVAVVAIEDRRAAARN